MAIQLGFDLIKNIFLDTVVFNIDWIISVLLTFFTLLMLSRDVNDWKTLVFPVMVGWHVAGIPPFFLMYIAGAMLFAIESLSLQQIGTLIAGVTTEQAHLFKKRLGFEEKEIARIQKQRKLRSIRDIFGEKGKYYHKPRQALSKEEVDRLKKLSGGRG